MKKNHHGGARAGAGRKPLPAGERKLQIEIYVPAKHVRRHGGRKKTKEKAEEYLCG